MDNPVWLLPLLLLLLPGRSAAGPAAPAPAAAATASSPLPDQLTVAMRHIEQSCLDKCADQNRTGPTAEQIDCDQPCYVQQCSTGCRQWQAALDSSCKAQCTQTNNTNAAVAAITDDRLLALGAVQDEAKELYCVLACNDALNTYFSWLIEVVGTPAAPVLVADTLTATALSLEWTIPQRLVALSATRPLVTRSYLVQWRYEEMAGDWTICRNQSIAGDNATVHVDNLHPYTKYRFRVALILSERPNRELFSEQSVIISTHAAGVPSSEPASVRATAVDHARISVSWEPGAFPNGKIQSYDLRIVELVAPGMKGYEAVQDLAPTDTYHMISNLQGGHTYNITVRMVNEIGPGPVGHTAITTLPEPIVSQNVPQSVLVLANRTAVCTKGTNLVADPFQLVFASDKPIVGIAIHVARHLLFVADEAANVYRTRLDGAGDRLRIRQRDTTDNGAPLQLSMDWLNDQLYMLVETHVDGQHWWHIARCDLSGAGETVVLAGLRQPPTHFEVDPYNGYLFWAVADGDRNDGLFRLDLADVVAPNGVQHEVMPLQMLAAGARLGPFAIDYVNFRLLVPLLDGGRIVALDLTGRRQVDVRNETNTQGMELAQTRSIASAGGLFFWTDGQLLWTEEFHGVERRYYKTNYIDAFYRTLQFIRINGQSAQPVPVPVSPPGSLQAVLDKRRAKLTWRVPRMLPEQGRGAWQAWNYLLDVQEVRDDGTNGSATNVTNRTQATEVVRTARDIQYEVSGLRPNTTYRFRAAAATADGVGPWSAEFRARTLREETTGVAERVLLWSSSTYGLLQTDMLGDELQSDDNLSLSAAVLPFPNVTRMAWHADTVYLVSNGTLAMLNRTTRQAHVVEELRSVHVQTVAVDWIGERLFWLTTDKPVIFRSGLDGRDAEALLTVATGGIDVQVDALGGWLYYASASTVAACRLNGRHRYRYYELTNWFADMQVQALALAADVGRVYWIGRGHDRASLFSAPMRRLDGDAASAAAGQRLEHPLHDKQFSGPLTYVSDRLVWLQDERTVAVGNLSGSNVALIRNVRMVGLRSVLAVDAAQHAWPGNGGGGGVNVRPEPVDARTIRVLAGGTSQAFSVGWQPVRAVTYGRVFYEVRLLNVVVPELSEATEVAYRNATLPPYTAFEVSVLAYTWWAKAPPVRVMLRTPAAPPGPVQRVRIFIQEAAEVLGTAEMIARIRWSEPEAANGPLLGWSLFVWHENRTTGARVHVLNNRTVPLDRLEYVLANLLPDTVYHVQVQVRSGAGNSRLSDVQTFDSAHHLRVPQLFVSRPGEIYTVDLDRSTARVHITTDPYGRTAVQSFAQIAAEQRSFWADDSNIVSYDGSKQRTLHAGHTAVLALCVDWVNRALFWSQLDAASTQPDATTIYRLDLNNPLALARPVESRNATVRQLAIDTGRQWLLWLESGPSRPAAAASAIIWRRQLLNNRTDMLVRVTGNAEQQELALYEELSANGDNDTGRIGYAEELARIDTGRHQRGQVAADANRLYWLDANSTIRSTDGLQLRLPNASHLFAIRPQRYPAAECLVPLQPATGYTSDLLASTDSSLQLLLPAAQRPANCPAPIAGTVYNVRFARLQPDEDTVRPGACTDTATCTTLIAYDRQPIIGQLLPFSAYKVQIAVSHYFAARLAGGQASLRFGPPVVFRTAIGAPSAPRQLTATALSPTELRVTWLPVERLNADRVWYEVQLLTQQTTTSQLVNASATATAAAPMSVDLGALQPGQLYRIAVRASSGEHTTNKTDQLTVRMPPEPAAVQLLEATAYTLRVNWTRYPIADGLRVVLQCSEETLEPLHEPRTVYDSATSNRSVASAAELLVAGLQPMTRYRFTVLLYMLPAYATTPYRWPAVAGNGGNGFVFGTHGDVPSAPGQPKIDMFNGNVYQITWEPAREHGSAIVEYRLEAWLRPGRSVNGSGSSRVRRLAHDDDDTGDNDDDNNNAADGNHGVGVGGHVRLATRPASAAIDPTQSGELSYTRMVHAEPRLVDRPPPPPPAEEDWRIVYNGTNSHWLLENFQLNDIRTTFRVCARNAIGWGAYSVESVQVGEHVNGGDRSTLLLAVAVSLSVALALSVCGILAYRCRPAEKKPFPDSAGLHGGAAGGPNGINGLHHHHHHHLHHLAGHHGGVGASLGAGALLRLPDVELATLREQPRNGMHLLHNNQLYAQHGSDGAVLLTDADAAVLPQIRRDRIVMRTFLGSGQFGDVYEGIVRHGNATDNKDATAAAACDERVAIKTLKKGASEHDKEEFLKEAQLMSNFKHEHIMRLIGVCFHADELYIIMELMQGGDLQGFLRQSRPTVEKPGTLTLLDLVAMCVDIAAGCRYLEEMHFVHRDLACRNCLVSSFDPAERVVKIGDFGLARDIYKNDYYRTDGKGPLPVRWMSPESLVDAVFTSQSDIWAFGVLCWEVMTLGQRPYPARNNEEVMQFVQEGGRLLRPHDCPDELYQLMLRCWIYRPEERPTFRCCLEVLQALLVKVQLAAAADELQQQQQHQLQMSMVGGGGGIVHNGAVSNRSYLFPDANHNLKTGRRATTHLRISTEGHELIEPPHIVTPTSSKGSPSPVPKYLDMLFEPDHCADADDVHDDDAADTVDPDDVDAECAVDDGDFVDRSVVQSLASSTAATPDSSTCNGYEIPIRDCDVHVIDERSSGCSAEEASWDGVSQTNSSRSHGHGRLHGRTAAADAAAAASMSLTMSQRRRDLRQRPADKERTFSSSSTVSEHTVFPDGGGGGGSLARLQVVLPVEECSSSRETLLTAPAPTTTTTSGPVDGRSQSSRRSLRQQNSLKRHGGTAPHRIALDCAEAKTIM